MGREIKFRAWEIDVEQMLEWCDLSRVELHLFFQHENYKIMQFTGLKDKNGTEIYEGDLVIAKENTQYTHFDQDKPYTVEWIDQRSGFYPFVSFSYIADQLDVIGNIYQNPELLNTPK